MEVLNGVCMEDKGGPPPPSPLTGCYLLIVIGEPHTTQHKDIILQKIAKGLLSWNVTDCLVDLEKELNIITEQALEGEEARFGERLIQFASENLVTEILIQPAVNTLQQCIRNLLSSFTKHRHIIHAGYTFQANGSWALQDGTFSYADFSDAFQELEVQRVIKAYENGITLDIHCSAEGEWPKLPKEPFAKACKVRINPTDVLTTGSPSITDFVTYLSPFLVPTTLESILESSDVVGNIRFSRPTLYVFPGGQGDAALFGINGFNMLLDGGYSRKACFWDFVRHLDRLDAVLLTRLNNSSIGGISSVLKRKTQEAVYPQIGHFFCNLQERRSLLSPDGDKDRDPLLINLLEEGQNIIQDLKSLNLTPQFCYRDNDPIILYHKVGHGTLNMYVLSPEKNSREVREFLQKWNSSDQRLFSTPRSTSGKDFMFPLQNLVSICALLVWQPSNPNDTITRILYPGSTPQKKIFDGLDRLKGLEYIKHPVCSERSLLPIKKSGVKKEDFLDKIIPPKKITENGDNKTHEKENGDVINRDKHQIVKKTDSLENNENKNIAKSKKSIEESTNNKILENGGDRISKTKPKVDSKTTKSRAESQGRKKPAAGGEKKGPPTPKKTLDNRLNGETKEKPEKQDKDKTMEKKPIRKPSPSATPAKSTKDANNRKVVEEKKQPLKKEPVSKGPAKEEKEPKSKVERKPISRRPKTAKPPTSPMKKMSNGVQKPDSFGKRGKLDKEGTTDSSTVSTPSADQESVKKDLSKLTPEEIQKIKEKELKEMQEEQEAVKEIEAVFRKGEGKATNVLEEDARKIKADVSLDDKLETEEYLIIEKEEVESTNEIQKLTKDSQETEKDKNDCEETKKETVEPEKLEGSNEKEETQTSDLEKAEINADDVSEAKKMLDPVSDEKIELTPVEKKELLEEEPKEIIESQPEEKISANIESGTTTTAPTLPEDERITLDDIKEDQPIEEKHEREETMEKPEDREILKTETIPKENKVQTKLLPAVAGIKLDRSNHIRDIVKTPDEVADLPVHEEADFDGDFDADDKKLNEKIEPDDKKTEKGKDNEKETDILEKSELETKEEAKDLNILKKEALNHKETRDEEAKDVVNVIDTSESKKENIEEIMEKPTYTEEKLKEKSAIEKEPKDIVQVITDDEWVVISKDKKETLQEAPKDDIVQEANKTEELETTKDLKVALKNEAVFERIKKDIDVKIDNDELGTKEKKRQEDESAELLKDNVVEKETEETIEKEKGKEETKGDEKAELKDNEKMQEEMTTFKAQEKQSVDVDSKTEINIKDIPKDLDLPHDLKQAIGISKDPTPSVEEIKEIHSKIIEDKITTIKVAKGEVEKIDEKIQELKDNQLGTEELKLDQRKLDLTQTEVPKKVDDVEKHVEELTAIDDKLQKLKDLEEKKISHIKVVESEDEQIESLKKEMDAKPDLKLEEKIEAIKTEKEHDQVEDIKKLDIKHEEKTEIFKTEFSKSPEIAEKVTLPDSSPEEDELKIIDQLKHIDKVELGRKSPQEREKDVEVIVAGVAEVLKSDVPIEVLAEKLPFSQAFTQELRETHITTQDSPIIESKIIEHISTIHEVPEEGLHTTEEKIHRDKGIPKELVEDLSAKFPDLYGKGDETDETYTKIVDSTGMPLESHQEPIKKDDFIAESKELLSETSKITSDIQKSPLETEESEDQGTVHRMLVTASSEDGGEEIEICPVGTIIFSRSSESSGRSSPDPTAKMSHKSSIVDTISDTLSTVKQVIDKQGLAKEEDFTETKEKVKELESKAIPEHLEKKDQTNLFNDKVSEVVESEKEAVKKVKSEKSNGQSTPEPSEKYLQDQEDSKDVDRKSSEKSSPEQLEKSNLPLDSEKTSESGKTSGKSTPDSQEKKEIVVVDKANIIASLDQDSAKSSSGSSTPEPTKQKETGFFDALNNTLESAKGFVKDRFDEIAKGTTDTLAKVKEEKDSVLKDLEQKTDSAIKDSTDTVTQHKEDMAKELEKVEEKISECKEKVADKIQEITTSTKDKVSAEAESFKESAQKLENDIKDEVTKTENKEGLIDRVEETSKKIKEEISAIKTEVKEDLSVISKELEDTKQILADKKEKLQSEASDLKEKIKDIVKERSSELEELSKCLKTDLQNEEKSAAEKIELTTEHAKDILSEHKKETEKTLDKEKSSDEKKSSGEASPKSPALSGKGSPDLGTKKVDWDAKKMEATSKESSRTTSPDVKQKNVEKQVEMTDKVIKDADKLLEKSEQVLSAITPSTSDKVISEKPDIPTDVKDIASKAEENKEIFTRVKRDADDLDVQNKVKREEKDDPVKNVQEISDDFKVDKKFLDKEEKAIEAKVLHMQKSIEELEDMSKSVVFEKCENKDFKVDPEVIKKDEKQIEQEVKHLEETLDDVVRLQKEISFDKVSKAALKDFYVDHKVIEKEEKQFEPEVKQLEDILKDVDAQKEVLFKKVGEDGPKEYHVDPELIKKEEEQIEQEVKHFEKTLDDVVKLQKEISFEKVGEAPLKELHVDPEVIKKDEKQIEEEVKHLEETLDDVIKLQKEISFEKLGEATLKELHVDPEVIKKEEKQIEEDVKHLQETLEDVTKLETEISFEKVGEASSKEFKVDSEVIKDEMEHHTHITDEVSKLQNEVSFDKISDDLKTDPKILEKEETIIQQEVEHVEKILNDVEKLDESISFDKCSISSTASTARITDHDEESKISEDSKEKPLTDLEKDSKEVQKEFIESVEHDTLHTVSIEKDKEKIKDEIQELQEEFLESIEHNNLKGVSIEKDKEKLVSEIKELQEEFVESIEHDSLKGVDLQKEKERVKKEIQEVQNDFIGSVEHDLAETVSVDKDKKKIEAEIKKLEQDFVESITHDNEEPTSVDKDHKKIEKDIKYVQEGFIESLIHGKDEKDDKVDNKERQSEYAEQKDKECKDAKTKEKSDTSEKSDVEKKLDESLETMKDQKDIKQNDKPESTLHDIKSEIQEVQDSFLDSIPSDRSISPESDRETSFEKELKMVDNKFLEERLKIGEGSGNKSEIKYEVGPEDKMLEELKELKIVDKKASKEEKTDQPEKSDKNGETKLDIKSQEKDIKDLVNKVTAEVKMDFVEAEFKDMTGKELEKDTVTSKTQETFSKNIDIKTVEDKTETHMVADQKPTDLQAKDSDIKDLIEKVSAEVKMDFVEAEYQGLTGKNLVTEKGDGESMEKQKTDTLYVGPTSDVKKLSISDVEIEFKDKDNVKEVTKSFLEGEKEFKNVPSDDQIDSKVFKASQDQDLTKRDEKLVEADEKVSEPTKKEDKKDTNADVKPMESIASMATSSSTLQVSPVDANISGKSSPDISGKSTAPLSPSLKDSQSTDAKIESKIDSGMSEQIETDDDDLSTKSQVAASDLEEMDQQLEKMDPMSMSFYGALPDETDSFLEIPTASTYLFEITKAKYTVKLEDQSETEEELDRRGEYSKKHDVMTSSIIGELPPPKSDDVMTSSFIGTLPETSQSQTDKGDVVDQWGKPLGLPAPMYNFEEHHTHYSMGNQQFDVMTSSFIGELPTGTTEDFSSHRIRANEDPMTTSMYFDSSEADQDPIASWGKPLGLPSPGSPKPNFQGSSEQRVQDSSDPKTSPEQNIALPMELTNSRTSNIDPIAHWGKPLGLPSPAPPSNGIPGTPKKEKKLNSNIATKNKINDDKKRALSPSKREMKKVNPVYVDLTYVPHHGNHYYSYVDFFKRIRARYYVFSGLEPSRIVYDALLEAKQTWEDKDLEVTIIPTYDTDILGYWVAENEDLLAKAKIDLSPSASRCTINLQDHETSCAAYRLEF